MPIYTLYIPCIYTHYTMLSGGILIQPHFNRKPAQAKRKPGASQAQCNPLQACQPTKAPPHLPYWGYSI